MNDAITAGNIPDIYTLGVNAKATYNKTPFIKNPNAPRVSNVIGNAMNFKIGFKTIFSAPKTIDSISTLDKSPNTMSSTKRDVIYIDIIGIIRDKESFFNIFESPLISY
jgi:hypothetical protein